MIAQEAIANEAEVVLFDGNKRVTFTCRNIVAAQQLAEAINSDAYRCKVESFGIADQR